jgi:hypothetical protein
MQSLLVCVLLCMQGIAVRLAGGEDAVFGDELTALAQQADSRGSSSSGSSSARGPAVRLAANSGLAAEKVLQQLQSCMQEAAAGLA